MRFQELLTAWLLIKEAMAWNSFAAQPRIYTFQEFYSDAQYGPDFGYYSTGRILQSDGPADNGVPGTRGDQEWFNSYTTLPMSVSPDFAHALCDRLVTMWHSMGEPNPILLTEFGGGTGMLARDILRRARDAHSGFYEALVRYVIAERSQAMRNTQRHTAAEFAEKGKLIVVEADARKASLVRPVLDEAVGDGQPVIGFVVSNELLDEFDPVRLRLVWRVGRPPSSIKCQDCRSFREAHVLHRIDGTALSGLLKLNDGRLGIGDTAVTAETLEWEGKSLMCGLLETPALSRAMLVVAEDMGPAERSWCSPMLVCCFPFVLAVDQALLFNFDALTPTHIMERRDPDGTRELVRLYRYHLHRTNGTIPLSKERYRDLRQLAASRGQQIERALLIGSPAILPGRVYSEEVFLALSPSRCEELQGWLRRNAERLAETAKLRNGVAWIYDGDPTAHQTTMHLKIVLRPGESSFAVDTSKLVDHGFMVTFDYGADADALAWQSLIRPNYEGIHIMDARHALMEECTAVSYLECPGLQDLTTSVDFTEVAVAGKHGGGWEVRAYGPIMLLEFSFDRSSVQLAPAGDPYALGHLVERAGGLRTTALQAWYRKPEQDPWASFKMMVQHRGRLGADWSLGNAGKQFPLRSTPRLFHSPSPCWRRDLTKPPLASLITAAFHRAAGQEVSHGEELAAVLDSNASTSDDYWHELLLQQFQEILLRSPEPLAAIVDAAHVSQQHAFADLHLAMLLVDYWHLLSDEALTNGLVVKKANLVADVREIATSRRLPELYGESNFDRVMDDLISAVFTSNITLPKEDMSPPYVCLAACALHGRCSGEKAVLAPVAG